MIRSFDKLRGDVLNAIECRDAEIQPSAVLKAIENIKDEIAAQLTHPGSSHLQSKTPKRPSGRPVAKQNRESFAVDLHALRDSDSNSGDDFTMGLPRGSIESLAE